RRRCAGCRSECSCGYGARAESAQVHSAGGPSHSRSDHDHRIHHPQSRVHDLDTLFATDAKFQVQPQMVDKYELSKDQLTYTFTLRDGLKFHDGAPVRSADCIASIERWAKRDALGQKMAESTEAWTAVNDKTFTLKLKKPFPLTLEALAKPSSNVPFIMPERIAKTDAST